MAGAVGAQGKAGRVALDPFQDQLPNHADEPWMGPHDRRADHVQAKIPDVACPKCGKKDCVTPVYCRSCGKPFASPKTATKIKEFKCPHCGKSIEITLIGGHKPRA